MITKTVKYICALIVVFGMASCYDLDEMSRNPYELADNTTGTEIIDIEDDSEYADININYVVSHEDSVALQSELADVPSVFRNFLYEGYYNDYQRATNLTHDIYSAYSANNQPKFAGLSPDYLYQDGWSALRWSHFYVDRCKEYRQLLRSMKFNPNADKYKNLFYATRIYMAFIALAQTDTYGDMPFKEYVQAREPETNNVAYNTQEEVYDAMFRMLEQAVDSIQPDDQEQFNVGTDDICYQGDWNKWLRFANTLRLRMALRISNVAPERAKKEAMAALNSEYGLMTSNDDNMQTVPKYARVEDGGSDDGGNENVFAMISIAYGGELVLSKDMENFYRNLSTGGKEYQVRVGSGRQAKFETYEIDPRCIVCWYRSGMTASTWASGEDNMRGDYVGCVRGTQPPRIGMGNILYSTTKTKPKPESKELNKDFWFSYSRPSVWLGYSESLFLKAEAALRGWTGEDLTMSAEEYFRAAIQASMDYYQIDEADATRYIDGVVALNDGTFESGDPERILEAIITHKYMAVFPNGNEGWAEFRRTEYPALANPWANASGGDVPQGKFIKRVLYPYSENNNQYFLDHADLQAKNTQGTRLWWDVADTNEGTQEVTYKYTITVEKTDENGEPILDDNGEPIMEEREVTEVHTEGIRVKPNNFRE